MLTLKSLNKLQHSLLHSRLLGTPFANVLTQYIHTYELYESTEVQNPWHNGLMRMYQI